MVNHQQKKSTPNTRLGKSWVTHGSRHVRGWKVTKFQRHLEFLRIRKKRIDKFKRDIKKGWEKSKQKKIQEYKKLVKDTNDDDLLCMNTINAIYIVNHSIHDPADFTSVLMEMPAPQAVHQVNEILNVYNLEDDTLSDTSSQDSDTHSQLTDQSGVETKSPPPQTSDSDVDISSQEENLNLNDDELVPQNNIRDDSNGLPYQLGVPLVAAPSAEDEAISTILNIYKTQPDNHAFVKRLMEAVFKTKIQSPKHLHDLMQHCRHHPNFDFIKIAKNIKDKIKAQNQ